MRALVQRVKEASVEVEGKKVGAIHQGLLVLLGIHIHDDASLIPPLVDKMIHLRIFSDEQQKMNRSLLDVQGGLLLVSQFTLYGDCSSGRRPSFTLSAKSEAAFELYQIMIQQLKQAFQSTSCSLQTGTFGAMMQVHLVNDGPITLLLEQSK